MIGGYYGILMKLMVFNQTVWFFFKADTAECYDSGNIPSIFHGIYG